MRRCAGLAAPAGALAFSALLGCATLGWAPPPPPVVGPDGVVAAPLAPSGPPSPVVQVEGVVFDDRDGDGARGAGEPGVPGVLVSNGVDVVATDDAGRYHLALTDPGAVFVIKPRDWWTALDRNRLPRFYYLYAPGGSKDAGFRFPGVAPTGPLPASVDFPLTHHPESDRFVAVAMGDPQPYDLQDLAWYARDVVSELAGSDAAFAIMLGDLVGNDLSLYEPLNEVNGLVGIPFYPVMGNHDVNPRAPDDASSDATYERVYGPPTYAFQVARVHFVVLDDVVWGGAALRDWMGRGSYVGGLRPDQLRFLENLIAEIPDDDLLVLAMHIPLRSRKEDGVERPQRIFQILSRHPRNFSMSGHLHVLRHRFFGPEDGYAPADGSRHHHFTAGAASGNRYRGVQDEDGIPHMTMRDGSPSGYALIEFDGADYSIRYKASGRPASFQMDIAAPDRVAAGEPARVVVNVFNGSPRSRVEMRVGEGARWHRLSRFEGEDPFYLEARERERLPAALALQAPVETNHLWEGSLPADLAPGAYLIEIRATDMWGRVDRASRPVLVE